MAKVKKRDFEVLKAQLEDYAKKHSNKTRAICNVLSKSKAIEYIFQKGNKKSFDFILDLLTLPNIINLFNQNGSQYLSLASIEGNIDSFDFIKHILGNSQIKTVDDNEIVKAFRIFILSYDENKNLEEGLRFFIKHANQNTIIEMRDYVNNSFFSNINIKNSFNNIASEFDEPQICSPTYLLKATHYNLRSYSANIQK